MALINFEIDDTDPNKPKIHSPDVLNLHPGDRLLFQTKVSGKPVYTLIGNQFEGTLVALVKFKLPPKFIVRAQGDGFTVELQPGTGNGPDPDFPDG